FGFYTPTAGLAADHQAPLAARPPWQLACASCRQPATACPPASTPAYHSASLPAHWQGDAHLPRRACSPLPDGEVSQLGNLKRQFFPTLKIREVLTKFGAYQIWGGVDSLPYNPLNAGITELEFGCMKVPKGNQGQCKSENNNTLMAKPLQF
ncbi:hypothetical protein DSO57_1038641, partial [Entomophthora muscae]